jgi:hypothetical protein
VSGGVQLGDREIGNGELEYLVMPMQLPSQDSASWSVPGGMQLPSQDGSRR